jgi:hypothetical protein
MKEYSYSKEHRLEYDENGKPILVTIVNKSKVTRSRFLGKLSALKFKK